MAAVGIGEEEDGDDQYDLDDALRKEAEFLAEAESGLLGLDFVDAFHNTPPSPASPKRSSPGFVVTSSTSASSCSSPQHSETTAPSPLAGPLLPVRRATGSADPKPGASGHLAAGASSTGTVLSPKGLVQEAHLVASQAPRRRRLRRKTPIELTYWRKGRAVLRRYSRKHATRDSDWVLLFRSACPEVRSRAMLALRKRLGYVCLRDFYEGLLQTRSRMQYSSSGGRVPVRSHVRQLWRQLRTTAATEAFLLHFIMRDPDVLSLLLLQRSGGAAKEQPDKVAGDQPVTGCLGTWNGRWLMEDSAVLAVCQAAADCEEAGILLRETRGAKRLHAEFHTFVQKLQQQCGFEHWSFQLELTPDAFRQGRMHIHMYWSYGSQPQVLGPRERWRFGYSVPLLVPNKRSGRHNRAAIAQGHFYCQADKIGAVSRDTNCPKHTKLMVKPGWVQELFAMRKMSERSFIRELLAARGRARGLIEDLRWQKQLLQTESMHERSRAAQAAFAKTARPFKVVAAVEEWRAQYERGPDGQPAPRRGRYKFLVLTGPSQVGKSMFAQQLFPPCHQCFCLGQTEPDLRHYDMDQHRSICCEEVEPKMVLANRLLFQAGMQIVTLAQSKCQQHAFSVFVHGVPFILCSNDWLPKLRALAPEEQEWLNSNSIVVPVMERLYED